VEQECTDSESVTEFDRLLRKYLQAIIDGNRDEIRHCRAAFEHIQDSVLEAWIEKVR